MPHQPVVIRNRMRPTDSEMTDSVFLKFPQGAVIHLLRDFRRKFIGAESFRSAEKLLFRMKRQRQMCQRIRKRFRMLNALRFCGRMQFIIASLIIVAEIAAPRRGKGIARLRRFPLQLQNLTPVFHFDFSPGEVKNSSSPC